MGKIEEATVRRRGDTKLDAKIEQSSEKITEELSPATLSALLASIHRLQQRILHARIRIDPQ